MLGSAELCVGQQQLKSRKFPWRQDWAFFLLIHYTDSNLYLQKVGWNYIYVYNYIHMEIPWTFFFFMTFYSELPKKKSCRFIILISTYKIRGNYVCLVRHHYFELFAIDCLSHSVPMAVVCWPLAKLMSIILSLVLQWMMKTNEDFLITVGEVEQKLKPFVLSVFTLWRMDPRFQVLSSSLLLYVLFWTKVFVSPKVLTYIYMCTHIYAHIVIFSVF